MTAPALVAVIGPVEPALLAAWISHYRGLGVERFVVAFHFPEHVPDARRHELLDVAYDLGTAPAWVSTGPWHEHTNTELRDGLRDLAGPGWHLLADSDELQQYPAPLSEVIAAAETDGRVVMGGLMLDRVSGDGHLRRWRPDEAGPDVGLDRAFPLGGHLTHRVLHGDPRKIVLARADVVVASGNHRAPGHKPDPALLACVHHFKWRAGVLDDLRRRVHRFSTGTWAEHTSAVRDEATRLLDHVAHHDGRIDIDDPRIAFRPVTLQRLPDGWAAEARAITIGWRPAARTGAG
jgi:hypothetical protein